MHLTELLTRLPDARPLDPGDPEILGVDCDSRLVRAGHLFAAVRGARTDGRRFLPAAAAAGAVAALVDDERCAPLEGFVRVLVDDVEASLGKAAAAFWGDPSEKLLLVGITGTNGKTTTSYLLQHLLEAAGRVTGRFGTVSYAFPSGEEPASLTTPDAPTLQRALARLVTEKAQAAVIEVSSHALDRRRVEGCRFACTVFTNLTQDHLDHHGTLEAYFEAKRLLFTQYRGTAPAVVNVDDPWGKKLAAQLQGNVCTYGLRGGDVRLAVRALGPAGFEATLFHPGPGGRSGVPVQAPLAGEFNVQNAAAALAAAWTLGLDLNAAAHALSHAPQVPGRLEGVANDQGLGVFVDYAHTPDALERVLDAVRGFTPGRVVCVFGCGGDRDRGKRPLMARAAAERCHGLVLTADNSRSENTEAILDDVEGGLPPSWTRVAPFSLPPGVGGNVYARVPDRALAIAQALAGVSPGDTVVLAGKGHERTQTLGTVVAPFDDREEARSALAARAAKGTA